MDPLEAYRRKRNQGRTPTDTGPAAPEPEPASAGSASTDAASTGPGPAGIFVVQEHHARRLHWDFRLEHEGVLVSWALPRGVPDDPATNHLAVPTEDHPLEYADFAGEIPRGEYGAGRVTLWDRGTYDVVKWDDRELKVVLHGQRLAGGYALFRTGDDTWMIHRERQPLPPRISPMLARTAPTPPDDGTWAHEMKWDGFRALAYIEGGRVRLLSRTGQDITGDYPELRGLAAALGRRQAVLDGEIVALGADNWPDFEALQQRTSARSPAVAERLAASMPVTYLAFDLLHLDGRPLLDEPYHERRALLEALALEGPYWQTPPSFTGERGRDVLAVSVQHGLEGIVSKRLASRYEPGKRTGSWRKIKNIRRQEVVVGGWKPGGGARTGQIGSLLIGVQGPAGLEYAGHVGTGFTEQTLRMLGEELAPLRRSTSPFATPVPPEHARPAVWAQPVLVIEVAFTGWTRAGRMRAPSYQGLRTDKDPADVHRELHRRPQKQW
jgi:bifunctional non-homologous end joining protein LigD